MSEIFQFVLISKILFNVVPPLPLQMDPKMIKCDLWLLLNEIPSSDLKDSLAGQTTW